MLKGRKGNKLLILALCLTMMMTGGHSVIAEDTSRDTEEGHREVVVQVGSVEFTESRTLHELSSICPDMTLRPSTNPWTDKVNNLWGVGLNGVNPNDKPYVENPDYPYTLVNNGLASRIMVQFNGIIPRALREGDDPTDPEVIRRCSIDVPGQYKLIDNNGNVYYTYCCDVATDANLQDTYNGKNVEEATYYKPEDAEHIRYICMNGYWGSVSGMGSLEVFKQLLLDNGVLTEAEAAALTHGEALTATQAAIWKFGNSELSFAVDESVVTGPALKNYYFSSTDYDWLANYIQGGNQIKKIYDFLIIGKIPAHPQITVLTKANSLDGVDIEVNERISQGQATDSDVYLVDLSFEIGTEIIESDELKVLISQNEETLATVDLTAGEAVYKVTDLQLQENSDIILQLNGSRELNSGCYIFEAEKNDEAQTLVGVAAGTQFVGLQRSVQFEVNYQTECTITAEKILEHGELEDGQFSFELLDENGELIETVSNAADGSVTFSPLQFTVEDLDRVDDEGCLTYVVREVITDDEGIIFDSAEKSVKVKLSFDGESFSAKVTDDSDDLTFINKVTIIDIPVRKIWKDQDDQYKMRPHNIIVRLFANGEDTGKYLILNAENKWQGVFTELPAYIDGEEIIYEVKEDKIPSYNPSYTREKDTFTITNTFNGSTPPTGDRDSLGYWLMLFSAIGLTMDLSWMNQTIRHSRKEDEGE